jgi:hypothetical protein
LDEVSFTGLHETIREDRGEARRPAARPRPADRSRFDANSNSNSNANAAAADDDFDDFDDDDFDDRPGPERHPVGLALRFVVVLLVLLLGFSVGSALAAPGEGSMTSKLGDWARDKHVGFVVDAVS